MSNCRLMTLNILTDGLYNYGDSKFSSRINAIEEMIEETDPWLIGIQEVTKRTRPVLEEKLKNFGFAGESRGSLLGDEYSAILYRKDCFELLNTATFWLSRTPQKKGSKFLLSQFPRIVTMAYLRDRESGKVVSFYNTHLDHNLESARIKQAGVLADIISKTQKGSAVFVCGDFNDVPGSKAIAKLVRAGLHDLASDSLGSTLKGKIGSAVHKQKPIDHIFVSCDPARCTITKLDQKYAGVYPSDHYPLIAEIEY